MRIQKNVILRAREAVAALTLALAVAAGTAQPYPTAVLADHPIAYWRLQETSGTIAHDIAGSYNGVFTNVLVGQTGYTNGSNPTELAVAFGSPAGQSADSFVGGIPLDVASAGNTNFSVEAWVNGYGQATGAGIVGKGPGGGGEEFFLDCGAASSAFRFFIRNAAGTAYNANGTVVADGNWHHLVGVCDEANGQIYLYVDGQSNAVSAASGGIHASPNLYLTIGARQSGSGTDYNLQFNGSIGEVATYNYALSATQVLTHYLAAGIAPVITLQPTNYLVADEGSTITLIAAATGTPPLSYQWTANGTPLVGQTNATLLLTNVPATLNGNALVLTVTNAYGSAPTPTYTFLTVNSGAPQLLPDIHPLQLALYQGLPVTYSVGVSGTEPFHYQWFHNGAAVSGANTSSYTVSTLPGTNTYSVAVSNAFGGGSITPSSTATLVGVPLPTASYPSTVLTDHPIAFWRLDESSGASTANDYAGGHDGTYTSVQLGLPGYSALFDSDTAAGFGSLASTDSYMGETDNSGAGSPLVDFSQPAGSNAAFSVEAWVNAPATPIQNTSGSAIVAKGASGSEQFCIDASGPQNHFRFFLRNASGSSSTIFSGGSIVPDGNWHHLVGVCDESSGGMLFYVDGANQGTIGALGGTGLRNTSVPVSVGAQSVNGDYTYQFVGKIDEVAIYNYALSAGEVAAHFNAAPIVPYFTAVPVATTNAYVGETVTLSATAAGSAPLTNQWYANSSILNGQTNLTLVLTNVQAGTNTYELKVSNAYGSVTNLPGTVVQVPAGSGPPLLVTDAKPLSTTRYSGVPLTYSVAASGSAPLFYQWYFNSGAVSGATNASLSFSSLNATNAGTYYCHINNSLGSTNSSTAILAVVAAPTNPYSLRVISDHPVAYYRLDETAGPIGYDYVGGNNGYYSNNVGFGISGCFNNLYDNDTAAFFGYQTVKNILLGGSISNIDFAVPAGQNGAFSVEAWAKGAPNTNQVSGGAILAKGVGNLDEQFALDAHSGFRFYVRNAAGVTVAGAQSSPTVAGSIVGTSWQMDNKWHHLVGVCDQVNSNILLYVDGTLIGPNVITNGVVPPLVYALDLGHSGTGTNGVIYGLTGVREPVDVGPTFWNANTVSIGSRNSGAGTAGYTLNFIGGVDEVAFYNYVLTPLQVSNHYAVAINSPLKMSIGLANGYPSLAWPGTYATATLQSATNITGGPWGTVTNAASPYSVTNPAPQQFYRLKLY